MSDSGPGGTARVTLYGRAGCHLCDVAREIIAEVCADMGEDFVEIDIDQPGTDPELRDEMTDQVPVTLVDGARHDFWRVDPGRLRAALAR